MTMMEVRFRAAARAMLRADLHKIQVTEKSTGQKVDFKSGQSITLFKDHSLQLVLRDEYKRTKQKQVCHFTST